MNQIIFLVILLGIYACFSTSFWLCERRRRKQMETKLHVTRLGEDSFEELVESIRVKQHDFYNHLQALRNQRYAIHDDSEFVREQEAYCDEFIRDNRFYALLNPKSPIVTGFLYGKFAEADRQGIQVAYRVRLDRTVKSVPEYILVEIIGILWDNAIAYVRQENYWEVAVEIEEMAGAMRIAVENPVRNLSYEEICAFFRKGYSTKPGHSGLGLYKVKQYSRKYSLVFRAEKKMRGNQEWLKMEIVISDGCQGDIFRQKMKSDVADAMAD